MKCVKVVCEIIRTAEKFEFGAEQKRVNRVDLKNAAKSASDKISSNAKIGFGTAENGVSKALGSQSTPAHLLPWVK